MSSSTVRDLLAGIQQLLLEQQQDSAQQNTYINERQEIAKTQRAEIESIETQVTDKLDKIVNMRKESSKGAQDSTCKL
jgi:hypothetical protein